jgi:hypothetical protein
LDESEQSVEFHIYNAHKEKADGRK